MSAVDSWIDNAKESSTGLDTKLKQPLLIRRRMNAWRRENDQTIAVEEQETTIDSRYGLHNTDVWSSCNSLNIQINPVANSLSPTTILDNYPSQHAFDKISDTRLITQRKDRVAHSNFGEDSHAGQQLETQPMLDTSNYIQPLLNQIDQFSDFMHTDYQKLQHQTSYQPLESLWNLQGPLTDKEQSALAIPVPDQAQVSQQGDNLYPSLLDYDDTFWNDMLASESEFVLDTVIDHQHVDINDGQPR